MRFFVGEIEFALELVLSLLIEWEGFKMYFGVVEIRRVFGSESAVLKLVNG